MESGILNFIGLILLVTAFAIGGRLLLNYWLSLKGWGPLSKLYPASGEIEGTKENFVSMGLGGGIYKNCVVLIYNDLGLYMRMLSLFKMFHPPLFIPWNQFQYNEINNPLSFNRHKIEIGIPPITYIILNDHTFKRLRANIQKNNK